jgi:hypothetical protein
MSYYFLSVMSSRVFHSRDLDGLQEALTDEDAPDAQTMPPQRRTHGDSLAPRMRLTPRMQARA